MRTITIENRVIGEGQPAFIIAEGCDNHMGNMDAAKEMCRQAKLAGADCIKFQHHLPDEEMLKDVPMSSNFDIPLYDFLKLHALTLDQHVELMNYCKEIGIMYLCTPFSLKAAYELNEIGVSAFKIGSGEMTDVPTLQAIAKLGKPMIVSTGMCTMDEIKRTYDALAETGVEFAFTNCLSEYPPKYEDVNLGVIAKMKEAFPKAVIGHSDHTPDLYTCYAAAALGAVVIEKHFTLDRTMEGPDHKASLEPAELRAMVEAVRNIESALGDGVKRPSESEKKNTEIARKSIVAKCPIRAGERLTEDNLTTKRPGNGISPMRWNDVVGKTAVRDFAEDELIEV